MNIIHGKIEVFRHRTRDNFWGCYINSTNSFARMYLEVNLKNILFNRLHPLCLCKVENIQEKDNG